MCPVDSLFTWFNDKGLPEISWDTDMGCRSPQSAQLRTKSLETCRSKILRFLCCLSCCLCIAFLESSGIAFCKHSIWKDCGHGRVFCSCCGHRVVLRSPRSSPKSWTHSQGHLRLTLQMPGLRPCDVSILEVDRWPGKSQGSYGYDDLIV